MHGTNIQDGVILMSVQPEKLENGTYSTPKYQEFVISGDEFKYWSDQWIERVKLYYFSR
jgi:hypothetical protein